MKLKALKIAMVTGLALMFTVAAGTIISSKAPTADAQLPEYVGSDACMGCHSDFYDRWDDSGHNHMFVQVMKPSDLPGPVDAVASPELKDELLKADWIVAGQRFVARDPNTGDMTYLNVQWDAAKKQYVSYKGGTNWTQQCAGCHTTGWSKATATYADPGIGCEMCHGPGRDHILSKGDPNKIYKSSDALVCGQCHNAGATADGTRWPEGFRPGMELSDVGFTLKPWSADQPIPTAADHLRQYQPWLASKHAQAVTDLTASGHASDNCYKCHSAAVVSANQHGETIDIKAAHPTDGVSCVTCHSAHSLKLKKDEQTTCTQCHTAEIKPGETAKPGSTVHHPMAEMLAGYGAIGVAETKGAHSTEKCIDCHMTEGNHAFKILKPSEVAGTNRKDTCTTCHSNSSPESRGAYLDAMQEKVESMLASIGRQVEAIDAALKTDPAVLGPTLDAYKAARTNWTFVDADGSNGAHNFEYAVKILSQAQKDIQKSYSLIPH